MEYFIPTQNLFYQYGNQILQHKFHSVYQEKAQQKRIAQP